MRGMGESDMDKVTKQKLKAFFAAQSMDVEEPSDPDDWTFGGASGMSIEKINETIDAFDETKIN